ncbi:MAG: hypothetical protein KJO55_06175 [Gammaproteobacteria bacterium]|nr:hypothetical protein [Gammaproteobacteria bacterium]NND59191.1 hypothetical protein [Gammaproteobacteria bacterium]
MIATFGTESTYLPPLGSSPSACVRWRWQDLDDALNHQLALLDEDRWANRQRVDELFIRAAEPRGHA